MAHYEQFCATLIAGQLLTKKPYTMKHIPFLLTALCTFFLLSANAQDDLKAAYFFKALEAEDYEKMTRYLENGVSVNYEKIVKEQDRVDGRTHKGPIPYHVSEKSRTPLIRAIELKKIEVVRFLVEKGADVNQSLDVVWYEKCKECPLKYGYKPMQRKSTAYRPISWAIDGGDLDIIDFLISKGADFSRENERIRRTGNNRLINYFYEKGMRFEYTTDDVELLYKKAYAMPQKYFVRTLLANGVEVNTKTLFRMLERKDTISLKMALDNGADVNTFLTINESRICLLCKATLMCDLNLIRLLVEDYQAKSNVVCDFKVITDNSYHSLTPMEIARHKYVGKCKGRNDKIIEYFLWLEE